MDPEGVATTRISDMDPDEAYALYAMDPDDVTTTLNEIFRCLRWPVFESVHNIRVLGDTGDSKVDREIALPFDGHPIGEQPATEAPFRKITCIIDTLQEYAAVDEDFEVPKSCIVRRPDNGTVTVKDVIEQLSTYLITHKDKIILSKINIMSWDFIVSGKVRPDTRVFFTGFTLDSIEAGMWNIAVDLWAEGEFGETVEKIWGPD